ncbi:hypothetical protein EJ06DRAFT_529295 [Trichodelitschia bisporula]|uniref:Uncharacterized protein n=1 Tax=Trichodelitschia bisporula TaxID=703511 RepID=A0A6G1HZ01_9PEZI|nr:hypothetical protein EJ06DRAFT_529295 [Trichodelitschia bisporula]
MRSPNTADSMVCPRPAPWAYCNVVVGCWDLGPGMRGLVRAIGEKRVCEPRGPDMAPPARVVDPSSFWVAFQKSRALSRLHVAGTQAYQLYISPRALRPQDVAPDTGTGTGTDTDK